jgi:hypothetical protein
MIAGSRKPEPDVGAAKQSEWEAEASAPVALYNAIAAARRCAEQFTGLPFDGIAASGRHADGGWRVVIDVVESAARMGDNDLLAVYEVLLTDHGELTGFARLGRYHREDGAGP